jgi:hypothetical protein
MTRGEDTPKFVEVRVFVGDQERKPADLSLITADLSLMPREGKPFKRALQLMMPDPAIGAPEAEPQALPDGRRVRAAVARFSRPFEIDRAAEGTPSAYFKADVPEELAKPSTTATVEFHLPTGKQKVEFKSLFK